MKVLIAENMNEMRFILRYYIEKMGCQTLIAEDESEVWEHLRKKEIDIVIFDSSLGIISPYEFCNKIRFFEKKSKRIYSLISVTNKNQSIELAHSSYCADDYLFKPFSEEILKEKISNAIQHLNTVNEKNS